MPFGRPLHRLSDVTASLKVFERLYFTRLRPATRRSPANPSPFSPHLDFKTSVLHRACWTCDASSLPRTHSLSSHLEVSSLGQELLIFVAEVMLGAAGDLIFFDFLRFYLFSFDSLHEALCAALRRPLLCRHEA